MINITQYNKRKKPFKLLFVIMIALCTISFTSCNNSDKNSDKTKAEDTTENIDEDDEIKDILEADRTEENEDKEYTDVMVNEDDSIDNKAENGEVVSEEEEEKHPFTFEELYHNVYVGTIGKENIIMDIYPNTEDKTATISFIGDNQEDSTVLAADILNDYTIVYKDKKLSMYLSEFEDGVLSGTYDDKSGGSVEVSLKLSHINYVAEVNQYYTISTNEKVEAYAKAIQDVIMNDDIETLSKMISYPISVRIEEGATADDAADLINMSAPAVITTELKEAISSTYKKFMFCNAEGIMLGSGDYNIWFTIQENGDMKIIALNN